MALPHIIKTVAVIRAGPSGIAAAKYLLSKDAGFEIIIFEQRSKIGGIWNTDSVSSAHDMAAFPSPVYPGMESNIPSEIMQFDRCPFPEGTPLPPEAEDVLKYIQAYGKQISHLVKYRHQVTDVSAEPHEDGPCWRLSHHQECHLERNVLNKAELFSYREKRSVVIADGHAESAVDHIIFCTGYNYEYPFLSTVTDFETGRPHGNTLKYQHIFHVDHPTLAFVILPLHAVAFPFAETQAAVIARVWSGRLRLPPREEMLDWVVRNQKRRGENRNFHKLSYPADAEYMIEMYRWCMAAERETESHLRPPFWGAYEKWLRETIHDIRRATEARGERAVLGQKRH